MDLPGPILAYDLPAEHQNVLTQDEAAMCSRLHVLHASVRLGKIAAAPCTVSGSWKLLRAVEDPLAAHTVAAAAFAAANPCGAPEPADGRFAGKTETTEREINKSFFHSTVHNHLSPLTPPPCYLLLNSPESDECFRVCS